MKHLLLIVGFLAQSAMADLVIYSDRPGQRFAAAMQEFEQQTGEKVIFVEGTYSDLSKRLELEGSESPADILITKDLVYLADAKQKGLFSSLNATAALQSVPAFMRGANNEWVALTFRVRTAIYNSTLISKEELSTYKDLANPESWPQSLCVRTGKAAYNEALVAGLIFDNGLEQAQDIVKGWLGNTQVAPLANDNLVIEAVMRGQSCVVGIVNHYYLAIQKNANPGLPVEIAFLDQDGGGVYSNGTAAALLKTTKNAKSAQQFIELLLREDHQLALSASHFEYPAVEALLPNTLIKDWGTFKKNAAPWDQLGTLVPQARKVIEDAGYL